MAQVAQVRSDDDAHAVLTLSFEQDASGSGLDLFVVKVRTTELTCDHGALTAGGDGLSDFFADLARNWRGWDGRVSWDALEHGMTVEATHQGRLVELVFILRRDYKADAWQLRLPILIAPGEALSRVAGEVAALFRWT